MESCTPCSYIIYTQQCTAIHNNSTTGSVGNQEKRIFTQDFPPAYLCEIVPAVHCEVEAVALDDGEDASSNGGQTDTQTEGQEQGVQGTFKGLGIHPQPAATALGLLVACLRLQLSLWVGAGRFEERGCSSSQASPLQPVITEAA